MASFQIDGANYSSKLFDGAEQVRIMRRLLPTFTALIGVVPQLSKMRVPTGEANDDVASKTLGTLSALMEPVAQKLADLSDADVDYIINACLGVTQMQNEVGTGWFPVRAANGVIMHQRNNRFATRLIIAGHVISENFSEMFASFGLSLPDLMSRVNA